MPTNIEVLKSIKKYTENLQEGELPEWIAPLFMDQPSPEYDTPEESAFDTALQELDNQNLDPNNPSAALSATLGAAKTHNVNPNQVVDRSQFRGTLRDIAKNVSLAIAVGIKADPERDKREQNTRTALSTLTPEVIGLAQAAKPEPNFPSLSDDAAAEAAAAAAAAQQAATTGMGKSFGQMEGSQESQGTASAGTGSGRGGTGSSGSLSGGYDGPDSGADSSDGTSGAGGMGGYLNTGGRVGALIQHLQTGGDVENADTNMEVANVPMGVVDDPDGAPGPFSGGTGVEDDLDMDVEAGSYVLNAESVQLIGISDINEVIRDAYAIAAALGKPMPQDYDPQNKVPIRISNGEAVIPKSLVDIIGLDKLEKWNQKGLELRKQKEEFMAQQQQAQPPQGPQVAAEAPMQQQMGQLMNKGGKAEEEKFYNVLSGKEETIAETVGRGENIFSKKDTPSYFEVGSDVTSETLKNYLVSQGIEDKTVNLDNALKFAEIVSSFESDNNPNAIQDNDLQKRGRGLFQFERNFSKRNQGAETAVIRARRFNPNLSWLSKFKNNTFDVVEAELTPQEQTELFIINHTSGPGNFIDTTNNFNPNTAFEYYKKYHYGGKNPPKKDSKRYKEFMNTAKKIINR